MPSTVRAIALGVVLTAGLVVLVLFSREAGSDAPAAPLTWVATANQRGVVGYRDPVGAISPDGTWVAYSEGAHVRVVPIGGGASLELPRAEGQVRHLAWDANGSTLVVEDTRALSRWWRFDVKSGTRAPVFGDRTEFEAVDPDTAATVVVATNSLRNLAPSPDGRWMAGTAAGSESAELWRIATDGTAAAVRRVAGRLSGATWTPDGEIACIVTRDGRSLIASPCGGQARMMSPDVDAVGPIAFSPDGATVYFASPNGRGMVDLWSADWRSGRAMRLTTFDRDTYAPSVAGDGTVLFRTQSYRTFVTEMDLATETYRQLATFQSETPSYAPDGRTVAVTFGTWRRVVDDANYPDIAQEIGTVPAGALEGPAAEPLEVIAASVSEDQAMAWSPNGRWIAFHSHREMSDDVWLRPADGSRPDQRITFLGRGAEVGWPRWSPDGRRVLFDGASPDTGRSALFVVGVDQDSGEVTSEAQEIAVPGIAGDVLHAEWLGGSDTVVAIAREAAGRHVIFSTPVGGGTPRVIHRFDSEHDFSGLASSPDGREVAFIQRATDGFFQVFRLPLAAGASPVQLTTDPSNKTQPAWSPDGARIAYTVWSYQAHFWTMAP